jgi:hypothetical protein
MALVSEMPICFSGRLKRLVQVRYDDAQTATQDADTARLFVQNTEVGASYCNPGQVAARLGAQAFETGDPQEMSCRGTRLSPQR